jgi:uncharacterized membrane-anchored protein
VLFAVVIAIPALGHWRFRLNSVIAFWWAYIATRPLGASVADWLSKPTAAHALGFGDGPVAAALLLAAVALLTSVAVKGAGVTTAVMPTTRKAAISEWAAGPAG